MEPGEWRGSETNASVACGAVRMLAGGKPGNSLVRLSPAGVRVTLLGPLGLSLGRTLGSRGRREMPLDSQASLSLAEYGNIGPFSRGRPRSR